MIKVKMKDLVKAEQSLNKVLNTDLQATTAFKLSRLLKKLDAEFSTHNEQRGKLIKKFGKEDESGNWFIPQENTEAIESFSKEYNQILEVEVDIPDYKKVSIEELNDVKLSAIDFSNIEMFVATGEEK